MRVLVTGASSSFAQALVPALCADARITAVGALDTRPARFGDPKFQWLANDIRDGAMPARLPDYDALVHLDSVALPVRMSAEDMFDLNVRAAHKLFHLAREAGVGRLIHMSTAAVYGNAVHADEKAPLRPLPGFRYAEHQAQLERVLAIEFPECVRLRPHVIVGPHAHHALKWLLRQPFYPRLPSPQPLVQCIHEDDLARAVLLCLHSGARGAYNLAIEESFSLRDAIRQRHWVRAGLPSQVVSSALRVAGRYYRWGADPGLFQALSHTLLVNCRRAIVELGWRSTHTVQAALASI